MPPETKKKGSFMRWRPTSTNKGKAKEASASPPAAATPQTNRGKFVEGVSMSGNGDKKR